ncbi:uncharacterized protein LY89DRAFT_46422 [Mollisia scopiformis]|uniref:Uncharacterized protein n=1 Tax=Mollisia scopiformis TaxID=149040 RepID=A0A194XEZ7_MOLSC|nr:uncharacterized protein LY89DRAFT_46422 [Mollisia scopiformis]KUJ18342.1 hypothetical protein LY89DRAFT_46422 [Mollisia scopiformis]
MRDLGEQDRDLSLHRSPFAASVPFPGSIPRSSCSQTLRLWGDNHRTTVRAIASAKCWEMASAKGCLILVDLRPEKKGRQRSPSKRGYDWSICALSEFEFELRSQVMFMIPAIVVSQQPYHAVSVTGTRHWRFCLATLHAALYGLSDVDPATRLKTF